MDAGAALRLKGVELGDTNGFAGHAWLGSKHKRWLCGNELMVSG